MTPGRMVLAAGAGVFVLALLVQAPAALLGAAIGPAGIAATTFSGTVWQGEARGLRSGNLQIDQLRWTLHPSQLLLGRLAASVAAELPGGFARADVGLGLNGRVSVADLAVAAPLAALAPGSAALAPGSELAARLTQMAWRGARPEAAVGNVRLANVDLGVPGLPAGARASFSVDFDSPALQPGEALTGRLTDLGGPLEVSGLVLLAEGWNYEISGTARARPGAPAELGQVLQLAGPQRADGSHEFSLAGSL